MSDILDDTVDIAVWDEERNNSAKVRDGRLYTDSFVSYKDDGIIDAFGRLRVSNPTTLFDSKQIFDKSPLLWDELLESGSGITSSWSQALASSTIQSTLNTAGKFTRQTFMRFNYQPGKSQMIIMTGVIRNSGGGEGVKSRIGYFDDDNGVFFEDDNLIMGVVRRTSVSGSPVDNRVTQANWNVDKMDGTGNSGITVDWTKAHIYFIDFEWLGVGRARMGLVIDGKIYYVHEFLTANVLSTVWMSTPNLPLRYQLDTTSSSTASSLVAICATVISEGGKELTGTLRHASTPNSLSIPNTNFRPLIAIRLKESALGSVVTQYAFDVLNLGSPAYEVRILFNPTISGTFTYNDITNSSLQLALGSTSNTITSENLVLYGYYGSGSTPASQGQAVNDKLDTILRLGAKIDGTRDSIVVAVKSLGASSDFVGGLSWVENI